MISLATEEDIPVLVTLVKEFCLKTFPSVVPSDDKIIETLAVLLVKGVIILLKKEEKIVGLLGAMKTELMFSRETMAVEIVWYVQEKYRGRESLRMQEAFEYWANLSDCKTMVMGQIQGAGLEKLLVRRGYALHEQSYKKDI